MTKTWKPPYPEHPAVDWTQMKPVQRGQRSRRMMVEITCPWCKEKRFDDASQTIYRVKKGTFTGYCYKDRLLQKARSDRLPRLDHPAVRWDVTKIVNAGRQRLTRVQVTCPTCKSVRFAQTGSTAAHIREGRFTGICVTCSPRAKKRGWTILSRGRKIEPNKGYIRLGRSGVAPEDLHLFDAMKLGNSGRGSHVMEHRLVMARMLGRPLTTRELVDHMDGDKLNNEPSNLRLYIRGKNMPGETTGYGTYYHEWQMALAEIRRLKGE
jgi:hypothetical protein